MDIIHLKSIEVFQVQVQGIVLGIGIAFEYVFTEWIISGIISHHFTLWFVFPFPLIRGEWF